VVIIVYYYYSSLSFLLFSLSSFYSAANNCIIKYLKRHRALVTWKHIWRPGQDFERQQSRHTSQLTGSKKSQATSAQKWCYHC